MMKKILKMKLMMKKTRMNQINNQLLKKNPKVEIISHNNPKENLNNNMINHNMINHSKINTKAINTKAVIDMVVIDKAVIDKAVIDKAVIDVVGTKAEMVEIDTEVMVETDKVDIKETALIIEEAMIREVEEEEEVEEVENHLIKVDSINIKEEESHSTKNIDHFILII